MACSKVKDVHNIEDFEEMYELMKALGVSTKKLKGLEDMKSRVKGFVEEAKSRQSWSAAEFSSIVLKVKEDYVRKSKMLLESYTEAEKILTAACKEFSSLKADIGDYEKHVKEQKKSEFFLLVTGQTSAGKSLLINLLLGEEILPSAHTRKTSTICEIKYGKQRRIKAHLKSGDPKTTGRTMEISLKPPSEDSDKSYSDQISPFVDEKASLYNKVELFWPHPLLQNGIVIVDSPGVGEAEELDTMVYQYIPEVFAFIYVISLANSDGIQKDTLGKLFNMVKNTYSLQKQKSEENVAAASTFEEDTRESEMSHEIQERLLSKCALFVSNKLDILEEKDVQNVEEVVVKKLTKIWPGVDPKSQVVFMSAKNATNAQKYGFVAESFSSLMRKLKGVITQGTDHRLEIKWRWLNEVLSWTIAKTKSSLKTTCQDQEYLKEKVKDHMDRLEYVARHKDEIMTELRKRLEIYQRDAVTQAHEYLSSEEVIEHFTRWTEENVPQVGVNWSDTEENIQRALSNRFKETLQHWLEEYMLLAGAQKILQEVLQRYFPHGEDHLRDLSQGLEEGSIPSYRQENLGFGGGTVGGAVYAAGVAFFMRQAASFIFRLAIPTSLVVLGLSMDVFYYLRRRWDSQEFAETKEAFMSKQAKNYLAQMADPQKLSRCVKLLLEPVERYLDEIGSTFPILIAAEREEFQQLENEKRSLDEVKDAYAKIYKEGCRQRGHHAVLGLTEMCSIQISSEALDWKADIHSRLGGGTFGDVYTGKMRQDRETKYVALKVSKKQLNVENASEFMNEIELLRTLNGHRHIVQFYGISLPGHFLAMILEKCEGNLADYIFKDKKDNQSVPGTFKKPTFGIQTKFQWAREITDGLAFIHAKKVVHRDLKPENILVSEENSIKIADVGLAKPAEIITGSVAGTYTYMAPEVYDSERYNEKVDIYSLGIILWEMWYGERAYQWPGKIEEFFRWLKHGNRPVNKGTCEPPWKHLMRQCWSGNPENRPAARDCKREIERVCSLK